MKRRVVLVVGVAAALAVLYAAVAALSHDRGGAVERVEGLSQPSQLPVAGPAVVAPLPAGAASLEGRVYRGATGVAGARVEIRGLGAADVQTVDGGGYAFLGLPEGDYLVWATAGREASGVKGPVHIGAQSRIDLELLPSASLEGTVVDAHTREPLAGARVSSTAGGVTTDRVGRFRFDVLPAGETWLEAAAAGHLQRFEWLGLPGAYPHSGLQLALQPSARIEGVVVRQGSTPVPQAQVWAEAQVSERAGQLCGPVTAGTDGAFALDCADGPLQLVASARGGARVEGPRIRGEAGKTRRDVRIELGEALALDGEVRAKGAPLGGAGLVVIDARSGKQVGGAVSDLAGRFHLEGIAVGPYLVQVNQGSLNAQVGPFEQTGDGSVWVVNVPESKGLKGRVEPPQAGVRVTWQSGDWAGAPVGVSTDPQGRFVFEAVPSGVLRVEAEGPAGVASARAQAGDDVVLTLIAASLHAVAVDEKGRPVSDYLLILEPLGAGTTRRIPVLSPEGEFQGVVGAGRFRVSATASGFGAAPPQEIDLNARVSVQLTLKAADVVRAVVLDAATRSPVVGAEVTLQAYFPGRWYAPARRIGPFTTDGRGEVSCSTADAVMVEVRKGSRLLVTQLRRVSRDSAGRLELLLPPDGATPAPAQAPAEVTQYEGVGMQLAQEGPRVYIWQTFEGSPAEAAGIQQGDTLVAVDGQPARAPAESMIPLIMGPSGTAVRLTVQRGPDTLEFVVRRRAIRY